MYLKLQPYSDGKTVGCSNCVYSKMQLEDDLLKVKGVKGVLPVKCGDLICLSREVMTMFRLEEFPFMYVLPDFFCGYYYPTEEREKLKNPKVVPVDPFDL